MLNIRKTRIVLLTPVIALAILGLAWMRFGGRHESAQLHLIKPLTNDSITPHPTTVSPGYQPGLVQFWDSFSKAVAETKPQCQLPTDPIEAPINNFAKLTKSFRYRPDLIKLPPEGVDELRDAHSRFVAKIQQLAPQLPFVKGTRGIVTTAAGEFVPILIVSIRAMRRSGSNVPVEVFIESEAVYEKEICEAILPTLNARCLLMSDILDAVSTKFEIARYQLKTLAMLLSSFDEVLLLDADNLVMEQPEHLFSTEPFASKGFVSWPDYWANTASPLYYTISSQGTPPPSLRASTEAGQLLLSKSLHTPTLLLATYYNIHGPTHYYPLLSQGAIGQGDKETYLAAATALNTSFYTVAIGPDTLGYHSTNEAKIFKGCAALQSSPLSDYNLHTHQISSTNTPKSTAPIPIAFIHAQTYKMDAAAIPAVFNAEINQRIWGHKEPLVERFGRDVEKQLWADTLYTGCQLEGVFRAWRGKVGVCRRIGRLYKFLFD